MHKYLLQLSEIAKSKGGKLLSDTYTNCHDKYKFEDELGNIFEAKGYSIKNGRWSPHTAQTRKAKSLTKYTIEDLKQFAESKGGLCKSDLYVNDKTMYLWQDSDGREFSMEWARVKGGQWSPHEKKETLAELHQKYSITDLRNYAETRGGKCLDEEYVDYADHRYSWVDRKGRSFKRTWSQVLRSGDILYLNKESKPQTELTEFVQSFGFSIVKNEKTLIQPYELDIFIPELNIAIEFHGMKWHSEASGRAQRYHFTKYEKCREKGITLIQIFDYEWKSRKQQIKSFLRSKFGKNENKVYARKLTLREVPIKEANSFLDTYHILGAGKAFRAFGLYTKSGDLLSMVTIGYHHWGKDEIVINRYIGKDNYTVIGGFDKLMKKAIEEYNVLYTWIDLRWSNGDSWRARGWGLVEYLNPDYVWYNINTKTVYSSKSTLIDKNDPKLTRVFDCGKLKLVMRNQ
jgi:hypothetical protein